MCDGGNSGYLPPCPRLLSPGYPTVWASKRDEIAGAWGSDTLIDADL